MRKAESGNPCLRCQAVCCQNIVITLTEKEVAFMKKGGTHLVERNEGLPHFGFVGKIAGSVWHRVVGKNYHMDRCGYLQTDKKGWQHCSVHEDSRRPAICSDVRSGGSACRAVLSWSKFRNME